MEPMGNRVDNLETQSRPRIKGASSTTDARGRLYRRASAIPPAIKRTGTNVSELQHALWNTDSYPAGDDSSSSESSTDDEDSGAEVDPVDQAHGADKKSRPLPHPRLNSQFRRFRVGNENYRTKGRVTKHDGRVAISIKDTSNKGYLARALEATLRKVIFPKHNDEAEEAPERPNLPRASSETIATPERTPNSPRLNVVIMVIGSRGDVQPFLKIGKVLKEQYGHRVRIATHPAFRDFVEKDSGLEFFSAGGNPSELMAFMVKNPGLIPTLETVRAGDIGRRRAAMAEMFEGFWRACISATDDEKNPRNRKMMGGDQPFIADLIIANPPSFAHLHCAEALGVPLLLAFTFPYTPTKSFPHPLATIKKSNVDPGYTNLISYPLVEMMIWQGLGDLVNNFRTKTLGLDPVSTLWAPGALYRLNVPFSYLWSPSLVPKPPDWRDEIDVSGFVFLDLASSYTPPDPLAEFLASGEAPIYIGFGSIVVDDADAFTEMIFEAVRLAGVRALVSKGWGGLGRDDVPDHIFMLDNVPHDWLFPKVKACVIHGGAGTTAIALKSGKPTMVVPFFGDQHFWGSMIGRAKAGPEAIPYKNLSTEKLAEGIKYCLTDEAQEKAQIIAENIAREGDGAENASAFFHKHLKLSGENSMRCSILHDKVAVWNLKNTSLRLSAVAAHIMVAKGYVLWPRLRLIRHCEWNDFEGPGEPVTGVLGSIAGSFGEVFGGVGSVPSRIAKTSRKRRERKEKQERKHEKAKDKLDSKTANKAETPDYSEPESTHGNAHHRTDGGQDDKEVDGTLLHTTTTEGTVAVDERYVCQVTEGVGRSAAALASAPIDLSVALAQGFHNAPRLYGDNTVRRPPRVTGIRSGLRAAGSEFVYGMYDAWVGVVRLPARGARNGGGVEGFTKGVGMGVTGWALKNVAALTGPVGYTLKGIEKQVERRRMPTKHIRQARIMQGQREFHELSYEEGEALIKEVVHGWEVLRTLWETVERKEKEKGMKGRISAMRTHGVEEAFESIPMAERILEALNRGETVQAAVEELRRSRDLGSKGPPKDTEKNSLKETRPQGVNGKSVESQRPQNTDNEKMSPMTEPIKPKDERSARPASAPLENGRKE